MFKPSYMFMTALFSFSAMSGVSFEEKKNRVEYLVELSSKEVSMNIDAYRRELQYEKKGLSLNKRAESEANLMAEKIKLQIQKAYEAALKNKSAGEAFAEVRSAIEKDIQLIAPELREEIKELSLAALENVQSGELSAHVNVENIQKTLLPAITDRSKFLNEEGKSLPLAELKLEDEDNGDDSVSASPDANIKEFDSKEELIESLLSESKNDTAVGTSHVSFKSAALTRMDTKINYQLKVEYMGVSLEAGPTITFSREYNTHVNIVAEGLSPVLNTDGEFDYMKRDRAGKLLKKDGKAQKRFMNFTCDSSLVFSSEYAGSGGFNVSGLGGRASAASKFTNAVTLSSRRIQVPELVDGRTVSHKFLTELCHNDFLNAQVTNNLTVSGSLNKMMENIVASLRFSHPKTTCQNDNQCQDWFNNEVMEVAKAGNTPRCIEESSEKFRTCELRGQQGQNCTVYDAHGTRISDGQNEFTCDQGLTCVKYRDGGWFKGFTLYQYAKGSCRSK